MIGTVHGPESSYLGKKQKRFDEINKQQLENEQLLSIAIRRLEELKLLDNEKKRKLEEQREKELKEEQEKMKKKALEEKAVSDQMIAYSKQRS